MAAKKVSNGIEYTEDQVTEFLVLANKVGIGKAKRELGYPSSWQTAVRWAQNRNVDVSANNIMEQARKFHAFYKVEDMTQMVEELINRVKEKAIEEDLDSDEIYKLAQSVQKLVNAWQLLNDKATTITESRSNDVGMDKDIFDLIMAEKAKHTLNADETIQQ